MLGRRAQRTGHTHQLAAHRHSRRPRLRSRAGGVGTRRNGAEVADKHVHSLSLASMEPKRHNTRHAAARAAAAAFSSPSPSPPGSRSPQDPKSDMYESFQAWALKTYGDSAKTKTVTRRKYNRILKILKGEEQTSAENSKFRFWVKAKGFRIGPPHGHVSSTEQVLYIPCSKVPVSNFIFIFYCLYRYAFGGPFEGACMLRTGEGVDGTLFPRGVP